MVHRIRIYLIICFGILFFTSAPAQKVKYKNLFVLLRANDFEQAEPFLRRFIIQKPDHPNANMYMGRMFEYKYTQLDVLKEGDLLTSYCDSAVIYYQKAHQLIDDREVRKNDEYYQEYSRRDLRTGKFGVKLADVKFDLENRINAAEKTAEDTRSLREYFSNAVSAYTEVQSTYLNIADRFNSMAAFVLKSKDTDIDSLKKIGKDYEEFIRNFESFKMSLSSVPNHDYKQELIVKKVDGLGEVESPDFYADEVEVYDFKSWSEQTSEIIVNDIRPLKENLAGYDEELNELYRQVTEENTILSSELDGLTEKLQLNELLKYDPEPLPTLIFNFKLDEITYYSFLNHVMENGYLDTTNVDVQLSTYQDILEKYKWVANSYHELAKVNVLERAELYSDFVTESFGNESELVSYIASKGNDVETEISNLENRITILTEMSRWGFYKNDSIPLLTTTSTNFQTEGQKFIYNTILTDTLVNGYFSFGIRYNNEAIENFAARIGYDRQVDTVYFKPLDFEIEPDSSAVLSGRSRSYTPPDVEDEGLIYVFQVMTESGSNYEISNLHTNSGLKWTSSFEHSAPLKELNLDPENNLIILKMGESSTDGEDAKMNLVFDFEGTLLTAQE